MIRAQRSVLNCIHRPRSAPAFAARSGWGREDQVVVLSFELTTDHWPLGSDHSAFIIHHSSLIIASMDRIAALTEVLRQDPNDAFARYGLAMEHSNRGDFEHALAEFSTLLKTHPDYTAGYFMAAQTLAKADRQEDAKKMLTDGIASARRNGNLHAQSEMEAMLAELSQ